MNIHCIKKGHELRHYLIEVSPNTQTRIMIAEHTQTGASLTFLLVLKIWRFSIKEIYSYAITLNQ